MASVPTVVHEPIVAVATADASALAPRSVVCTAVASVPTAVREPAVDVATADASALAPRSAVATAAVSAPTVVHEPAVAAATTNVSSSTPSNVIAAVASIGTAVHELAVFFASPDSFAPAPALCCAVGTAVASVPPTVNEPVVAVVSAAVFA